MHKSLLIDSDVLIDHLRKDTDALSCLSKEIELDSLLFMSVVSRIEIIAGMRKGEEEIVGSLFDIISPVDVEVTIASSAGEYLRKFNKSHSLNIGDAIIAATCREMALSLVTRNLKHYPMKDIDVVKPY
jgi:predicted nucleic acid-binding protein